MNEAVNVAKIEARKWYTIMLGFGGSASRPFAAVEKTGKREGGYCSMLTQGMSLRPMCDVWRMIDENGVEMTCNDNDLAANGSIGIGSMIPCDYLPDLTDERLSELVEIGKRNAEIEKAEAEEAKRKLEERKAELAKEYAYLPNKVSECYCTTAKVAQNIRAELKERFFGVKFFVRSHSYSGGDSVYVEWVNGPARDDVDAVVSKYQDHHADRETGDYWDYTPSAFNEVFGGVSFVWCRREEDANAPDNMPKPKVPAKVVCAVADGTITVTENTDRNGIELRFPSVPDEAVRGKLKANGWRWSKFAKCWYIKASDAARQFANEIAAGAVAA